MKTTVVHVRDVDLSDPGVVYIGRAMPRQGIKASKWGNPYRMSSTEDGRVVLLSYVSWLLLRGLERDVPELRGKRLACWCKGKKDGRCHGDILAALADGATVEQVREMIERGAETVQL